MGYDAGSYEGIDAQKREYMYNRVLAARPDFANRLDLMVDISALELEFYRGLNDKSIPDLATRDVKPQGISFMGLGDSLTANGGCVYDPTTGYADYNYNGASWHMWAAVLSGGKLSHKGNASNTGYTIQQIKTTHLPTVLSAKPDFCTVLAGTNNLASLSNVDFDDLTYIYNRLAAAGIRPILCTIPPVATSYPANVHKLNTWINRQARKYGYLLLDIFTICNSPGTDIYKSGYVLGDNVHFTSAAAKAVGDALRALLSPALTSATPKLASGYSGESLLVSNPLFSTDNGATPAVATGWASLSNATSSFTTHPSGFGRVWNIAATANSFATGNNWSPLINGGDVIHVAMEIEATVPAGMAVIVVCQNGSGVTQFRHYFEADVPSGSVISFTWKAPAGTANYKITVNPTGNGTVCKIGRFTVMNLTALGVA